MLKNDINRLRREIDSQFQSHAAQKVFQSRVCTQRVRSREHLEIRHVVGTLLKRLLQPEERLVLIPKTYIDICERRRRHIPAAVEFEQLIQYLPGFSFA